MKGLIKKDLLMIKSNFKTLGLVFIIYVILAFQGEMDISFAIPFLGSMIMMSTFSFDNLNKWDAYAITFPNGRKNIVISKYLANFLFVSLLSLIELVILFIIQFTEHKLNPQVYFTIYTMFFATILFQDIIYPIIFRFGIEKARIAIFAVIFSLVIILIGLVKLFSFKFLASLLSIFENHIFLSLTLFLIILTLVSYKISKKIYLKKEF